MAALYRPPIPQNNTGEVPFSNPTPKPKTDNSNQPHGFFMKALDLLSRGNYASANAAMSLVKGDVLGAPAAAVRGLQGKERTTYSQVLEKAGVPEDSAALKAISGPLFNNPLFHNSLYDIHTRDILGAGLDIALDPTTYIGAGLAGKAGKVSKAIGLGKDVLNPEGVKLAESITEKVGAEAAQKSMAKILAETGTQYLETNAKAAAKARGGIRFGNKTIASADAISQALKSTPIPDALNAVKNSDLGITIQTKLHNMFLPHLKPPEVAATDWKKIEDFKDLAQRLYRVRSTDVLDEAFRAQRQFTKEQLIDITKAISESKGGDLAPLLAKHPETVVAEANNWRKISDRLYLLDNGIPVDRANEILSKLPENTGLTGAMVDELKLQGDLPKKLALQFQEGYIPGVYKKKPGMTYKYSSPKIFQNGFEEAKLAGYHPVDEGNIASVMGIRGVASARTASYKSLASNIANSFGEVIHEGDQTAQNIAGKVQLKNESMRKFIEAHLGGPTFFNKDIAPVIDEIGSKYTDSGMKDFLSGIQSLNAKFARSVTTPFPSHHFSNFIGNAWNMYLAGVTPTKMPELMYQAGEMQKLQHAIRMGDTVVIDKLGSKTIGKTGKTYLEAAKDAILHGVSGHGFLGSLNEEVNSAASLYKAGIDTVLPKTMSPGKRLVAEKILHPLNTAAEGGKLIEDNSRLALFLHGLSEGKDSTGAAMNVKKFLFDYGDLTDFEKQGMRTLIPFYAWSRKNIPLQVSQLLQQPGKFANIGKVGRVIEDKTPSKVSDAITAPSYIQDKYMIRLKPDAKGNQRYISPNIAFQDLARINGLIHPGASLNNELSNLSPLIKSIFEVAVNKDIFKQQQLADPNLPEDKFFWEKVKKVANNNFRFGQVAARLTDDQKSTLEKTMRELFGMYVYSSSPVKAQKYWIDKQKKQKKAVQKLNAQKAKKK